MLNDVDSDVDAPSGVNVKKGLDWLCSGRTKNDVVVFHYSGHGTQIPSDGDDQEVDQKDEAIVLEGMFLMADDDIKQFFSKLPEGCQATMISDCCHSGGMLDHKEVAIQGDKKDDSPVTTGKAPQSQARSLPISTVASIMSSKLGKPVNPTASGINGGMATLFGGDAGKLAMKFAASQFTGGRPGANPLETLLGGAAGVGGGGAAGAAMGAVASVAGSLTGSSAKAGTDPLSSVLARLGLQGMDSATSKGAPAYQPTNNPLSADVGILVTGCQSNETSADVRPPNGNPHGALTDAIKTVYDLNPNATYRELVMGVRAHLHKAGFSQNPQLECSLKNADLSFICGGGGKSAAPAGPSSAAAGDSSNAPAPGGGGPLSKLFKVCFKG